MKAYWITRCHVHNADEYNEYIKLAGPAITKFGGTFLVRGGDQIELEGGPFERTVWLNLILWKKLNFVISLMIIKKR